MVAPVSESYTATLELDPRSRQWMADIEGLPVHTWGRSLAKVKQYAVEALALHLDVPEDEVCGPHHLPAPAVARLRCSKLSSSADTAKTDAEGAAARAAEGKGCCRPGARPRRPPVHAGRGGGPRSLAPARPAVARQLTTGLAPLPSVTRRAPWAGRTFCTHQRHRTAGASPSIHVGRFIGRKERTASTS